jgi:hypothetical protein
MQVTNDEIVESVAFVNLVVFEAINAQLHDQIFVEVA